jgi:hypothetical protein
MRLFTALCVSLFVSSMALGQTTAIRSCVGYYGCGTFIPLVTTPEISLQTVSPSSVGASNATYGLVAGATNSTLSIVNGNTSSVYTQPVWYSGGTTPLISSPSVTLPVPLQRPMIHMEGMEREHEKAESPARAWTFYSAEEASPVEAATSAKSAKRAARTYTNQDVEQENQKNGQVKYDGKTEQIK